MNKPQHPIIQKGSRYPQEFRAEAVRYWLRRGKKVTEVARELGVSDWSLQRWRQQMEQENTTTSGDPGQRHALELAQENGRLRREVEALTRQREILKKAISIFSAENPRGGSR